MIKLLFLFSSSQGPTLLLTSDIIKQRLGSAALDRWAFVFANIFFAAFL